MNVTSFDIGQVWTFPETAETPQLIVTIGHIDSATDLGADAANCAVLSVTLTPSEDAAKQGWPDVAHAPLSQATFDDGTAELVMDGVSSSEGFNEGYQIWRTAFEAGNAGVFSVPAPQAYSAILEVYSNRA